jgi:hypothetical protein
MTFDGTLLFLLGMLTGAGLLAFIAGWWLSRNRKKGS